MMLNKSYKNISLITRIRNEEEIIGDFLSYYKDFPVYIYDDVSTDNTVDICKSYPNVKGIIQATEWDTDRTRAEYTTRQAVLELALKDNPEWILYVDADERVEFPDIDLDKYDGVRMKLFDFYITEGDKNKKYTEREYLGPEYRDILMMFRNVKGLRYELRDQREMILPNSSLVCDDGYVKHYGKAISIKEWESTCDYYVKYFPEFYKMKWEKRRGKAIHNKSDFGADLIKWEQRFDYGYPLFVV